MDLLTLMLTALALAMDAFAVSVSNGVCVKRLDVRMPLTFGFYFGIFQFLMALLGWFMGYAFVEYIKTVDHWIAFGLLTGIGVKMFLESFEEEKKGCDVFSVSPKVMLTLAIATSIDAMAVGVSFAVINTNVLGAAGIIGVTAFLLSAAGVIIGKMLGNILSKGAERLGALILVAIGIKILVEHLAS